jgi:hypothetical protein
MPEQRRPVVRTRHPDQASETQNFLTDTGRRLTAIGTPIGFDVQKNSLAMLDAAERTPTPRLRCQSRSCSRTGLS